MLKGGKKREKEKFSYWGFNNSNSVSVFDANINGLLSAGLHVWFC
jgi:hypothetical protein